MTIEPTIESLLPGYAQVLLKKGINLQKGQILVIAAPVEASDFVTILNLTSRIVLTSYWV